MGKDIVNCRECGAELLVERPGQKVGGCYVEIGVSNGAVLDNLAELHTLLRTAADDMAFREDLRQAEKLVASVRAELVTIAPEFNETADDW